MNSALNCSITLSTKTAPVTACSNKLRIALFGSYYRGFHVLNEILDGPLHEKLHLVGVATDDPRSTFISRDKRVWQYPHTVVEATMVQDLAKRHNVPVFTGRVKTPEFYEIFEQEWRPDYCIMATFGQRIDPRLYNYPAAGFFNLHPSDNAGWPSRYAGGNPFKHLIQDNADFCVLTLHRVDDGFDTGERIAISERIYIPPGASVTDMHKTSSPLAAPLVRSHLQQVLQSKLDQVAAAK
jgi:methionyl-tRNA formyltransferase